MKLTKGAKYKFVGQEDTLIFLGKEGNWNQFSNENKKDWPFEVWCEILDEDLNLIEKVQEK
jgi:hypothetical protein